MKKKILLASLLITIFSFCSLLVGPSTTAANTYTQNCLNSSGGRSGIPSVKWACNCADNSTSQCTSSYNPTNYQFCTLWIGSSATSGLTINVSSLTGTKTIAYWGMCTTGTNKTDNIWVNNANGSIDDSKDLNRGTWGNPTKLDTTLDISKFIQGITPTTSQNKKTYERNVQVCRQHGGNTSSSCQNQTIRIVYTFPITLKLNVTGVTDGYTITNPVAEVTTSTYNDSVSVSSGKYQGYTLNSISKKSGTALGDKTTNPNPPTTQKTTLSGKITGDVEYNANYIMDTFAASVEVNDKTGTGNTMKCANTGCNASFVTTLSRTQGLGPTKYRLEDKTSNSGWSTANPNIDFNFQTSFTAGNSSKLLYPGQQSCRRISYYPYMYPNASWDKKTACITASVTNFQGKTSIQQSGSEKAAAGWTSTNSDTKNYFFNCDNQNGCQFSFKHEIKKSGNDNGGSSNYKVTRTSNLTSGSHAISNKTGGDPIESGTYYANQSTKTITDTVTLYPGMKVCETLTFEKTNDHNVSNKEISTTVCVHVTGSAQPSDVALLNIKVSKDNGTNWYNEVYVKPGDQIKYRSVYQPKLQYAYNIASVRSELSNWKNAYTIGDIISLDYSYTNGSIDSHTNITPSSKTIQFSHVGTSLDEIVNTNKKAGIKNTPTKITFTQSGDSLAATVLAENKNWGTASARVPHNFINTTKIADETEEDRTAYAGEEKTVNLNIYTSKKQNSETDGYYATPSKDAKKRLKICFTAFSTYKCYYTNVEDAGKNGVLNENGLSTSSSNDSVTSEEKYKFTAPDLPAGTKIYIYSQVFPKDSGADTNYQYPTGGYDINNENHWATSDVAEYIIAKRPNLQILGGNVYSNGKIETSTSIKNCLAGVNCLRNSNNYNPNGYDDNYVFGSWGELGVISGGSVIGLASGATLGYQNLFSGYKYYTSCGRIPLTFANSNPSGSACLTPAAGALGNSSSNNSMTKIKDDIISKYVDKTVKTDSVPGGTIDIDTTTVYYSDDVLKIEGDLVYENTSYSSFANLPKLIIVAENEIGIGCSVNRIDGILIAKKVTTCTEVTNKKDIETKRENSNQLIINGAVITSELVANRTYGAATGENSSTPAEIINFDPSLYRWESGSSTAEATTNASTFLITTYQKELAPRY